MLNHRASGLAIVAALLANLALAAPSAPNAEVSIISPKDGAVVSNPVTVSFGAKGMEIVPAGTEKEHSGHHHLLIDVDTLPPAGQAIPKDEQHQHFGKGQVETSLSLSPGKHTLQLMLGDKDHIPHEPSVVSKKISITVK